MIKVNLIEKNGVISILEVTGHADYAEHGQDLVCAAVSAIVTGGFNAFNDNDFLTCSLEEGYARVEVISQRGLDILDTIIVQLKTIAISYPNYIKIK